MQLTVNVITDDGIGNPRIPLLVDAGGIDIGGSSNVGAANSYSTSVTNGDSVEITITQTGYRSYAMVIDNVFNLDKSIDILLVENITDFNDPDFNRPSAQFFTFLDPCNYNIHYYNASSLVGASSWYLNNTFFADGYKGVTQVCEAGDVQLKQRVQTSQSTGGACPSLFPLWDRQWASDTVGETGNIVGGDIDPIDDYLALDTEINLTVLEYKPDFVLTLDSPVAQLNDCCWTRGETVTITPEITLNRDGAIPANHTIVYTVTDPMGLEYILGTYTMDVAYTQDLVLEELGTYNVVVTLFDEDCNNLFSQTVDIETCNFIVINYENCGKYTVINKSSETNVNVHIQSIEDEVVLDETLTAGQAVDIEFPEISLYTLTVSYDGLTEIYILNNYCGLDDCIAKYELDILCKDTRHCAPCPDEVELNQMLILKSIYFMKVNQLYGWNNYYSALDETLLSELAEIKIVMDQLQQYCSRRTCNETTYGTPVLTREGPYDWMGEGSNCKTCNQ